jgi:hypothetical protein
LPQARWFVQIEPHLFDLFHIADKILTAHLIARHSMDKILA